MDASLENLPRSLEVYELALEGLTRVNEWIYRHHKELPDIVAKGAGVEYRREVGEHWRHVADVVRDGWGDCEDLACARAGYLRSKGEARARAKVVRTGPKMTHAVVRRSNGKLEDPSRALGMGREKVVTMAQLRREMIGGEAVGFFGDEADDMGEEWETIGADLSQSQEVTWTIDRTATGWKGVVRVPLDAGRALIVQRTAPSKKAAGNSALNAAAGVLDSPLAKALIPPQAQMALNLVRNPALRNAVNGAMSKLRHLF